MRYENLKNNYTIIHTDYLVSIEILTNSIKNIKVHFFNIKYLFYHKNNNYYGKFKKSKK